jgi:hypothetical protein
LNFQRTGDVVGVSMSDVKGGVRLALVA